MKLAEFLTIEGRESLATELTKEGLFELEKVNVRGNEYNTFKSAPKTLGEYFQFALIHGEWDFLAYEDETYTYQETLNKAAGLSHTLIDQFGIKKGDAVAFSM